MGMFSASHSLPHPHKNGFFLFWIPIALYISLIAIFFTHKVGVTNFLQSCLLPARHSPKHLTCIGLFSLNNNTLRSLLLLSSFYIWENPTQVLSLACVPAASKPGKLALSPEGTCKRPVQHCSSPWHQKWVSLGGVLLPQQSLQPRRLCEWNPVFPFGNQVAFRMKNYQALGVINTTFENETKLLIHMYMKEKLTHIDYH